ARPCPEGTAGFPQAWSRPSHPPPPCPSTGGVCAVAGWPDTDNARADDADSDEPEPDAPPEGPGLLGPPDWRGEPEGPDPGARLSDLRAYSDPGAPSTPDGSFSYS